MAAARSTPDRSPGTKGAVGNAEPTGPGSLLYALGLGQNAKKAPGAAAAATPTGADAANAHALLNNFLAQYGLGQLADWAWQTYIGAGGGDLGMQLVQAQLPDQAAYKQRFPAIASRVAAGLPAITPADYINYETTIRQAFSAHGLPLPDTGPDFEDMVTKLLNNDVSANEVVNQRIGSAFDRVANAPIEVRQAAEHLWGINSDTALAAFFLDPTKSAPQLEKLSQSMEVAGTASRFGIDLTADRAQRLADLGADQNLGAFQQLAQQEPLFRANQGENPDLTLENQGVGAAFGESALAQQQIARRMAERKAALGGGGEPYTSSSLSATPGIPGLGSGPT